jgi:hypothetical protein
MQQNFEPLYEHNNNECNIDQLLSIELVTTSQSLLEFTTTNVIPSQTQSSHHVSEHTSVFRRQQGRRRRHQRRQQQREQRRQRQQQQRQQSQQQPRGE